MAAPHENPPPVIGNPPLPGLDSPQDPAVRPVSLRDALIRAASAVRARLAQVRRALSHRDPDRAWSAFVRARRLLVAHLTWEAEDLGGRLDAEDLLDWPAGTRTLRGWQDLLTGSLSDIAEELSGPSAAPAHALRLADHAVSLLIALIEDYECDLERTLYRQLDEGVEAHDAEAARARALDAWMERISTADAR